MSFFNLFALQRKLSNDKGPAALKCSTPNWARNLGVKLGLKGKEKILKTLEAHRVFFIFNDINSITSIDAKTK